MFFNNQILIGLKILWLNSKSFTLKFEQFIFIYCTAYVGLILIKDLELPSIEIVKKYDRENAVYHKIAKHMKTIYDANSAKYCYNQTSPSVTEKVVIKRNDDWFRAKVQKINKDICSVELIDEGKLLEM